MIVTLHCFCILYRSVLRVHVHVQPICRNVLCLLYLGAQTRVICSMY